MGFLIDYQFWLWQAIATIAYVMAVIALLTVLFVRPYFFIKDICQSYKLGQVQWLDRFKNFAIATFRTMATFFTCYGIYVLMTGKTEFLYIRGLLFQ